MSRNVIMCTYEIGDTTTSLEFEGIWRTPTKNFVHMRSLCLPSFKSFHLIYEKKMKWKIPTFEAPSVLTHKIKLKFEKYQSESSPSIVFNGSHLVKAYNNSFQRYIVQNGPVFYPSFLLRGAIFPTKPIIKSDYKQWRLCIATAPATASNY